MKNMRMPSIGKLHYSIIEMLNAGTAIALPYFRSLANVADHSSAPDDGVSRLGSHGEPLDRSAVDAIAANEYRLFHCSSPLKSHAEKLF